MTEYELKDLCGLTKTAGMFGPSNAIEAQSQARRRTGTPDRAVQTGGLSSMNGQMPAPSIDMNGAEYRTSRMMSAAAPQQPQPGAAGEDEDDEGDAGNAIAGTLLGTGLAIGGKYLYDKYVPMWQRGQQASQYADSIQANFKKFNELISRKTDDLADAGTNVLLKGVMSAFGGGSQISEEQRKQAWMALDETKQNDALNSMKWIDELSKQLAALERSSGALPILKKEGVLQSLQQHIAKLKEYKLY